MVNAGRINAHAVNAGDQPAVAVGSVLCSLQLRLRAPTGFVVAPCRLRLFRRARAEARVSLSTFHAGQLGSASAALALSASRRGQSNTANGLWCSVVQRVDTTPLPPSVSPPPGSLGGRTATWQAVCNLGGLIGQVRIDAEENGARTAQLALRASEAPMPGSAVWVDVQAGGARSRLFGGRVVQVDIDVDAGIARVLCSDQLQAAADALSRAQIEGLTPEAIVPPGSTAQGYAYLQQRLASLPASAVLRKEGGLAIIPWSPGGGRTLSRLLSASFRQTVIAPSETPAGDARSNPPRRVEYRITATFSWVRIAQARIRTGWSAGITLCQWLDEHIALPDADTIERAVQAAGWNVDSLALTPMELESGWITCNGVTRAVLVPSGFERPIVRAGWTLSKRYTRTLQARKTWRVVSRGDDLNLPADVREQSLTLKDPRDGKDWVDFGAGTLTSTDHQGDRYADWLDLRDAQGQFGVALTGVQSGLSQAAQTAAAALAQAAVRQMAARRTRRASATLTLEPDIDLGDGVSLQHPHAVFAGQIVRLSHNLDIERGAATTEVELAAYDPPPASAPTPGYSPGDVHLPSAGDWLGPSLRQDLQRAAQRIATRKVWTADQDVTRCALAPATYIGGTAHMVPEDQIGQGWVVNKPQSAVWIGSAQPTFYPAYTRTGFVVRTPPIELPDQGEVIDLGETLVIV